jgi:hypothetical protein
MPWRLLPNDTLPALTNATMNATFPGGISQFFMTGDGHGHPPFRWALQCPDLKVHILTLAAQGTLCAHVELHQDGVTEDSVPGELMGLYNQGHIFGWELPIYRDLQVVMDKCLDLVSRVGIDGAAVLAPEVATLHQRMTSVDGNLGQIGNPVAPGGGLAQHNVFLQYFQGVAAGTQAQNAGTENQYRTFLLGYFNWAMGLRTSVGVHQAVAARIQNVINQYPNHTHIIACGDAHITTNPLYNYLPLPPAADGVADAL